MKAGTELAALEMIRSGTTTFVDMYYFEDQVAEACDAAGLRGVLGETLIEFPAPDNKTIPEALAYSEAFLKRWAGHPRVTAAVAPHSTIATPEKLKSARPSPTGTARPSSFIVGSADEQKPVGSDMRDARHLRDLGTSARACRRPRHLVRDGDSRILRDSEVGSPIAAEQHEAA